MGGAARTRTAGRAAGPESGPCATVPWFRIHPAERRVGRPVPTKSGALPLHLVIAFTHSSGGGGCVTRRWPWQIRVGNSTRVRHRSKRPTVTKAVTVTTPHPGLRRGKNVETPDGGRRPPLQPNAQSFMSLCTKWTAPPVAFAARHR